MIVHCILSIYIHYILSSENCPLWSLLGSGGQSSLCFFLQLNNSSSFGFSFLCFRVIILSLALQRTLSGLPCMEGPQTIQNVPDTSSWVRSKRKKKPKKHHCLGLLVYLPAAVTIHSFMFNLCTMILQNIFCGAAIKPGPSSCCCMRLFHLRWTLCLPLFSIWFTCLVHFSRLWFQILPSSVSAASSSLVSFGVEGAEGAFLHITQVAVRNTAPELNHRTHS